MFIEFLVAYENVPLTELQEDTVNQDVLFFLRRRIAELFKGHNLENYDGVTLKETCRSTNNPEALENYAITGYLSLPDFDGSGVVGVQAAKDYANSLVTNQIYHTLCAMSIIQEGDTVKFKSKLDVVE